MAQTYFASIQPGLENALLTEIRRLGGKRPDVLHGGVEFDAARKTLYAAHLELSTPTRIWLRVDEFRARDAPELYNKTRRYDWERLLGGEHRIAVRAHSSQSRLYHTGKIEDAVRDALRDRFDDELTSESAPAFADRRQQGDQLIMARLRDDRCQLSLDASGALLHRRGWRTEAGSAPLRETIASAMLELVDWQPADGLIDPMCGSATIVIEAARRAIGHRPGLDRRFAFQDWRNFQPERFADIKAEMRNAVETRLPAPVIGRDRSRECIDIASRNARRAGVDDLVELRVADLQDRPFDSGVHWIITNPPYGARLAEDDALDELLSAWQSKAGPAHICFLWPSNHRDQVANHDFDALDPITTFKNGGISVDLWATDRRD